MKDAVSRLEGRALVVDDHKTNRMKMELAVRNLGLEVECAANGIDCLAALRARAFDIVLLYIVMPGMDGFEVLQANKADPALRDLPVIVISSLEEIEDSVRAIELGAENFLTKPFNPVLLKARLGAGVERKRLRDKELEYLKQVDRLAAASGVIERKDFDPARLGLDDIAARDDQLGNMARVFLGMAGEVYRREQMLRNQINLLKGGFLLLLLGAVWGLMPSLSRIIMVAGLNPLGAAFWTLGISAAIMLVVSVVTRRYPRVTGPAIRQYLILGLFGNALSQLLLLWSASHVPAILISIILAAESFMVFIIAASFGLEAPSFKRFLGLCLGLACVLLIIVPGQELAGAGGWVWILLALGVPFCYAIEDIVVAALPEDGADPIATATGTVVAAALIMAPITLLPGVFIPPSVAVAGYGWAFALIAAVSSFSSVLLIYTIRTTGAVFASQAGYAMTAAGIFWSVLLLGETMSVWVWARWPVWSRGWHWSCPNRWKRPPRRVPARRAGSRDPRPVRRIWRFLRRWRECGFARDKTPYIGRHTQQDAGHSMQVALHAGAHMTDEDRLIACLAENRETLARFGTNVPPPASYRKLLRDILQRAQEAPLSEEAREVVIDAISTEDVTDRLVLSNHGFFGTPKMAVAGPILYPAADMRLSLFRQIFADDQLELFFGLRNPAMFLPTLLRGTPYNSVARLLNDNDPADMRWSELIARIRNAHADLPITVWCNEDTPMIWSQIVREMAGIDATVPIAGEFALLSEIMTKPGLQRFHAYIDSHPGMTEVQKRRVIAAFLDKFADDAAIEEELDVPGWTEDVVDRLTELYDEDLYEIQRLDGVQMITP